MAAFILAGASTLAHEVLWTRILSQYFRNSIYSFSVMLFAVLLALAAGGGVGSFISRFLRIKRFALGSVQLLIALASLGVVQWVVVPFNEHQFYTEALIRFGGDASFQALVLFEILAALALVFAPAFFMGVAFPLVANLSWRPASRFAGFVGDVQFLLTLGGVAGALIMARAMIPANFEGEGGFFDGDLWPATKKGLLHCFLWTSSANVLAGLLVLLSAVRRLGWPRIALSGVLLGLVFWIHHSLPPHLVFWKEAEEGEKLVFYASDRLAEVAVVDRGDGRVLKLNSTSWQGGTQGELLEARLGLLPILIRGGSTKALVMGLGTGNTLYGLLQGGAMNVDCVEIIPAVARASQFFHRFSQETLVGGRFRPIVGDARIFLRCIDETYDLILGDLYFPWQSEAGFMYTKEHFQRVKDRLTPDGVFFQWLPLHQLAWEDFETIGYTFSEVFDHVAVYLAAPRAAFPFVGLMGSRERQYIDPLTLQENLDAHFNHAFLVNYGVGDAMEILSLYLGDQWFFRRPSSPTQLNTEDQTRVEFRSARTFQNPAVIAYQNFLQLGDPGLQESPIPILRFPEMPAAERVKIEDRVRSYSRAMRPFLKSHALFLRQAFLQQMGYADAPEERKKVRDEMGSLCLLAYRLAPDYPLMKQNILQLWQLLIGEKEITAANNLMYRALSIQPDSDVFYNRLGSGLVVEGRYKDGVVCFTDAIEKNDANYSARANLAIALFAIGDRITAREEMERVVNQVGYENLSELTRALALLILEGEKKALPLVQPFLGDSPWKNLVKAALESARESAREGLRPGEENRDS
jgi:spermidine synthase